MVSRQLTSHCWGPSRPLQEHSAHQISAAGGTSQRGLSPSQSVFTKGWYDRFMKGRPKTTASLGEPESGVGSIGKESMSGAFASFAAAPINTLKQICSAGLLHGPAGNQWLAWRYVLNISQ